MLRRLVILAIVIVIALLLFALRDRPVHAAGVEMSAAGLDAAGGTPPGTEVLSEEPSDEVLRQQESNTSFAARVYGHLQRAGDALPVRDGLVRLTFEDHHSSAFSTGEAHAQCLADPGHVALATRVAKVRGDGWWFVDLPGRSWLRSADYIPAPHTPPMPPTLEVALRGTQPAPMYRGKPLAQLVAVRETIPTTKELDRALESGKLDVSFDAATGLCQLGVVTDALTNTPVASARVLLQTMKPPCLMATTGPDGSFRMEGIDPGELQPVDGFLTFFVDEPRHVSATRSVAWEPGQEGLVAFRLLLEQKGQLRR